MKLSTFCCRVPLDEIVVHPDGEYPQKCKAPRVVEIWEVDRYGKRIEATPAEQAK